MADRSQVSDQVAKRPKASLTEWNMFLDGNVFRDIWHYIDERLLQQQGELDLTDLFTEQAKASRLQGSRRELAELIAYFSAKVDSLEFDRQQQTKEG